MLHNLLKPLVIAATIAIISAASYWVGLNHNSVVFIDMKQAIAQPATMLAKSSLSSSKQQAILARYSSTLSSVIKDYGSNHHVTVIAASVLYKANANDITNEIITETLERVRHG